MQPIQIFISYSKDNYNYAKHLYDYLLVLQDVYPNLSLFLDNEHLEKGKPWEKKIFSAIESSSLFVCLYSRTYLNSHYVMNVELPAIVDQYRKRDALIMGFVLDDFPFQDRVVNELRLGDIQLLGPYDQNRRVKALNDFQESEQDNQFNEAYEALKFSISNLKPIENCEDVEEPKGNFDSKRFQQSVALLDRKNFMDAVKSSRQHQVSSIVVRCKNDDWPEGLDLRLGGNKHAFGSESIHYVPLVWPSVKQTELEFNHVIWEEFCNGCKGIHGEFIAANELEAAVSDCLAGVFEQCKSRLVVNYRIDASYCECLDSKQVKKLIALWRSYLEKVSQQCNNVSVILLFTLIEPDGFWQLAKRWRCDQICRLLEKQFPGSFKILKSLDLIQKDHLSVLDTMMEGDSASWHQIKVNIMQQLFKENEQWAHRQLKDELEKTDFTKLFYN